jgi:hypothetical protein
MSESSEAIAESPVRYTLNHVIRNEGVGFTMSILSIEVRSELSMKELPEERLGEDDQNKNRKRNMYH